MEVIPVVYTLKCVILAKYNSCDQTLSCVLRGEPTAPLGAAGQPICPGCSQGRGSSRHPSGHRYHGNSFDHLRFGPNELLKHKGRFVVLMPWLLQSSHCLQGPALGWHRQGAGWRCLGLSRDPVCLPVPQHSTKHCSQKGRYRL